MIASELLPFLSTLDGGQNEYDSVHPGTIDSPHVSKIEQQW